MSRTAPGPLDLAMASRLAREAWGRERKPADATTRPGAYFFDCARASGFIIDARCLAPGEYARLSLHFGCYDAQDVVDSGRVVLARLGRGPTPALRSAPNGQWRSFKIFACRGWDAWMKVGLFAGIWFAENWARNPSGLIDVARSSLMQDTALSAHDRMVVERMARQQTAAVAA